MRSRHLFSREKNLAQSPAPALALAEAQCHSGRSGSNRPQRAQSVDSSVEGRERGIGFSGRRTHIGWQFAAGPARSRSLDCEDARSSRADADFRRAQSAAPWRWRFTSASNYNCCRRADLFWRNRSSPTRRPLPAPKPTRNGFDRRTPIGMTSFARAKDRIDISGVNLPQPPRDETPSSRAPKSALALMLVVIVAMALIALYANVQRWRRA